MSSRVISIQSHVVHGYVGNRAAVFPLQLLGFDVDFINSVHFSNHTGYEKGFTGQVMDGEQLRTVVKGLGDNNLLDGVGYMLTGYIGSVSFCDAIVDVLKALRKRNKNVQFICDPVLGDDGRFYTPPELVKSYLETVIPMADVITPNQFEVEKLTGISITSIEDTKKSCETLHSMGPSIVFITSLIFSNGEVKDETISVVASRRNDEKENELWRITCPIFPGKFTGTGDLTASLLLGHLAKHPGNIPLVLEKVVNTMFAVVRRTHEASQASVESRELKLIQSKSDIENPPTKFKAEKI